MRGLTGIIRQYATVETLRLAVAIAMALLSGLYLWAATQLSIGGLAAPGPGLYPLLLGVGALTVAIGAVGVYAKEALRARRRTTASLAAARGAEVERVGGGGETHDDSELRTSSAERRRILFILAAFAYPLAIFILGFVLASIAFIIGCSLIFRPRPSRRELVATTVVAILLPLFVVVAFDLMFEISFPAGWWSE